ncbi:MAG: HK97 family phage prohead protease [Hoeflea sp.]|uniref:HK97 family phage prohead protease n=1 Tax=Hoeflea sp. TaxID=1940281 RepID=UPI001D8630E2|nr:HK97 family phage prohead protease [Hoeflea sp.]MBU4529717.1 HK97 family phage prohead protease [Alphaproteobacteria bacterium]MBU4543278.1 HK97 family phage prohead protease [Alphaproteobacteria bacterium]MBU4552465.1 HK97 family phage prohead protease [Alphaproteobacteria bacterium]MBV1723481.1 HK97 family phage prohead protease [Hoeflea sp.]MBV1762930.1 HK97 family phage prohead protease [Hoeflea sp.]
MTTTTQGAAIELDIKAIAEDGTFSGYASVFGVKDRGGDIVMPGAFKSSLQKYPARKVKMLWQHDTTEPIGVWTKFEEDAFGLRAEGRILLDTVKGREVYAFMKAEAVDGISIGFRTIRDEMDRKQGARLLHEIELREASIVTFPMNESATVTSVKNSGTDFAALVAAINKTNQTIKGI